MGRVRRYKKVKAIDPFSKQKGKKINELDRNLPPDVKNHEAQRLNEDGSRKRKLRRRLPGWAQEEVRATAKSVRDEYAGIGQESSTSRQKIEGKRPDENLRQFNKRVREETSQMLRDEYRENSATSKRKKRYLDDKKLKRKLKKQGRWEEIQRLNHLGRQEDSKETMGKGGKGFGGAGGEGRARAAEVDAQEAFVGGGDELNFPVAERLRCEFFHILSPCLPYFSLPRFGEVAHAPPNLDKLAKPRGLRVDKSSKPWARQGPPAGRDTGNQGIRGGTASGVAAHTGGFVEGEEGQASRKRQMEQMRQQVQDAYAGLKKKRRSGQLQFVASDL
ncbi:unnamed protein product [Choristocarpus tenellus]